MHKLVTPQLARLGISDVPPETDAVDPSFSEGTPESLKADLIELLGETQVLSGAIDLVMERFLDGRLFLPYWIMEGVPVIRA
jgi:hypothetical protein